MSIPEDEIPDANVLYTIVGAKLCIRGSNCGHRQLSVPHWCSQAFHDDLSKITSLMGSEISRGINASYQAGRQDIRCRHAARNRQQGHHSICQISKRTGSASERSAMRRPSDGLKISTINRTMAGVASLLLSPRSLPIRKYGSQHWFCRWKEFRLSKTQTL